jgi:hypothetical protein
MRFTNKYQPRRKPRAGYRFAHVRRRILEKRGVSQQSKLGRHRRLPPIKKVKKTWAMIALESRYRLSIEEMLTDGSLRHIQRRFGINYSTACRWRKRLGIVMEVDSEDSEAGQRG